MTASPGETEDLLDPAAAARLRRLGGDRLLGRMIDLFLAGAPERLADARAAARDGDLAVVERSAHSVKSSAGNLGAWRLQQAAQQLELRAEEGDAAGVEAELREVERALAQVEARLRAEQESLDR